MYEVIKKPRNPFFSVVVPFSRPWATTQFLEMFDHITLPRKQTELVFYADCDSRLLIAKLREYLRRNQNDFNGVALYVSGNSTPAGVVDELNIDLRRRRIVTMRETSKQLISDSIYVFGLEDDTSVPPGALMRLYAHSRLGIGYVGGVQAGRHGIKIIGAWKFNNIANPTQVSSIPYKKPQGVEEVDGAGFYCYITPTGLYKAATYHFDAEYLGPDVCYVWDLRKKGYKALVDRAIVCEHKTIYNTTLVPDKKCVVATWAKQADATWKQTAP